MQAMSLQAVTRLLRSIVVMLGACLLVFVVLRLAPGDPAQILLGDAASPEAIATLREQMGLNQPIWVQAIRFFGHLLRGDAGDSVVYGRPAMVLALEAFPATLFLGIASFAMATAIAVPIGIVSAVRRPSFVEKAGLAIILLCQSLPAFWVGILLIFFFAVNLQLLPTSGGDSIAHVVLPAMTLATVQIPMIARAIRSSMLEVLGEDYIRTARAKGASEWRVVMLHGFRNALIPVITLMAVNFGTLLSGTVVTEAVFAWPGIGTLAMTGILQRDYTLVQAIVIFSAAIVALANFTADSLYQVLDPRLRAQGAGK